MCQIGPFLRQQSLDVGKRLDRTLRLESVQVVVVVAEERAGEGIDCTTPAGRLQLHVLAALAESERARIAERVKASLARARKQGTRLGRPRLTRLPRVLPEGLTVRQAAVTWGVSKSTAARWITSGTVPAS